jgi:Helix-turn-helix domain
MTRLAKFSRIPARAVDMDLTATDWGVLHVIALHADKAGHAYPSLARIAEIAGIQSRHVARSTKRLERFGLLRFKRLRRGSGWANNQYEIPLDAPSKVVPEMGLPDDANVLPAVGLQVVPPQGIPSDGALTERLLPGRYQSGKKKGSEKKESLEGLEEMDGKEDALSAAAAARADPKPGKPASTISSAGRGNGRLKPGMRGFDKFD